MLLTNHVLSGALIGALTRRPAAAFAAGVASHFVVDAVPHWGNWRNEREFLRVAVPDGLISLAAIGAFAAASPPDKRLSMLAAMVGAALPDADKPTRLWFSWSPFPVAVDRFHSRIQREARSRWPVELAAATVFGSAALIALRRSGADRPWQNRLGADRDAWNIRGSRGRRRLGRRAGHPVARAVDRPRAQAGPGGPEGDAHRLDLG